MASENRVPQQREDAKARMATQKQVGNKTIELRALSPPTPEEPPCDDEDAEWPLTGTGPLWTQHAIFFKLDQDVMSVDDTKTTVPKLQARAESCPVLCRPPSPLAIFVDRQ